MNARLARSYSSPLRAEQAAQTRARIVQAAVDLLAEGDAHDLSMADVAARAGVSVRTVYRSFATREELFDGVIDWINEHLVRRAGPRIQATRADHESSAPEVMAAIFEIEPLYRALFATQAGRASHQRLAGAQRRESLRRAYAAELEGLDERTAHRVAAVLHLVASSNAALFLKDYWDLSPEEVGRTMAWAIGVLADAAADPKRRETL
jgi:AcrR family transcriptional regulator